MTSTTKEHFPLFFAHVEIGRYNNGSSKNIKFDQILFDEN